MPILNPVPSRLTHLRSHLGKTPHVMTHNLGVRALQLLDDLEALIELGEDIHYRAREQGMLRGLLELQGEDRSIRLEALGWMMTPHPTITECVEEVPTSRTGQWTPEVPGHHPRPPHPVLLVPLKSTMQEVPGHLLILI